MSIKKRPVIYPWTPWRGAWRLARVDFALGSAIVRAISCRRKAPDGEMIYHVEDINTGRQDFVGASWMKPVHKSLRRKYLRKVALF